MDLVDVLDPCQPSSRRNSVQDDNITSTVLIEKSQPGRVRMKLSTSTKFIDQVLLQEAQQKGIINISNIDEVCSNMLWLIPSSLSRAGNMSLHNDSSVVAFATSKTLLISLCPSTEGETSVPGGLMKLIHRETLYVCVCRSEANETLHSTENMLICNKVSTRQCSHFFTTEKRHRQETYYKHVQHIISHTGRRGRPNNGLGPRRKTHDLGGAENYDSGWCMQ